MMFIYFGERFSDQSSGWFGTLSDEMTGSGVEWAAVRSAILRGENVQIRQATSVEMAGMESAFAIFKAKGGAFSYASLPKQ